MAMIQSHCNPYKSLKEHVDEVHQAGEQIGNKHSPQVYEMLHLILGLAIAFHDLGKAIPAFQDYIKAPEKYRGNKILKAHTPVSLLIWIAYALKNGIAKEIVLPVSAAVWRHHGNLPTMSELIYNTLYDYEDDYKINQYPIEQVNRELGLNISLENEDYDLQFEDLLTDDDIESNSLETAALIKLKAQLLFSVLLESDRTFLALSPEFRKPEPPSTQKDDLLPDLIDKFIIGKTTEENRNHPLNRKRTMVRQQVVKNSSANPNIESVTLPTGLGKTLVAAQWALTHRQGDSVHRKVIIVLPFLSIIDQTVKEYKELFFGRDTEKMLLEAHSIAGRQYREDEEQNLDNEYNKAVDFYAETWNYDFIITTFDQFLYTLLSSDKKHLLRFHNLTDALIIMDEIQALPPELWEPMNLAASALTENFNTKLLIMSATQPDFIKTRELVNNPDTIFSQQNRYQLVLRLEPVSIDSFIDECIQRINDENWHEKKVLVVLNTRNSARSVVNGLEGYIQSPTYFLSADVTPKERLENIKEIKGKSPCLVIATQCIEAGVDIDMDLVIRDFAPLDSLIQCAGRGNRNGTKERADIEIVNLCNQNNKRFCDFVYNNTLLENTAAILSKSTGKIPEEQVFQLITEYFRRIKTSMNTGKRFADDWAYWRENLNVKNLLRGDNEKFDFIVASQDEPPENAMPLKEALTSAIEIEDRWVRERHLRKLKSRIAQVSISIWASKKIDPSDISEQIGCYNFLKIEYYTPGRGFEISKLEHSDDNIYF